MPYLHERATMQPLHALLNTPHIHTALHAFHGRVPEVPIPANRVRRMDLADAHWEPATLLACDGSIVEASLSTAHPHSRVVYLTVGATCQASAVLRHLDLQRPIDPLAYRAAMETYQLQGVLPFAHIVTAQAPTTLDAYRQGVYHLFCTNRVADAAESLLDTFAVLLAYHPSLHAASIQYPTDALGIHNRMAPWGGQWRSMLDTLRALECIWLIHMLRWWETQHAGFAASLAIVVDGPLAVFGPARWLSRAVRQELAHLFRPSIPTATVPMLIGIEKTGGLVTYAAMLDACGALEPQMAVLLTDADMRHARYADDDHAAASGHQHAIGRKFIYKTRTNQVIVVNVPSLTPEQHDATTASPYQFPRLAAIMDYLDAATQTPYQNGVSGVVAAHAASALPAAVLQHVALYRILSRDTDTWSHAVP